MLNDIREALKKYDLRFVKNIASEPSLSVFANAEIQLRLHQIIKICIDDLGIPPDAFKHETVMADTDFFIGILYGYDEPIYYSAIIYDETLQQANVNHFSAIKKVTQLL